MILMDNSHTFEKRDTNYHIFRHGVCLMVTDKPEQWIDSKIAELNDLKEKLHEHRKMESQKESASR